MPRLASSGVARSDKTFNSVSFSSHFVSIPVVYAGDGGLGCEVPAFAGTTVGFTKTTHATNVRAGRGDGAMGICHVLAGGAPGALIPGHGELHP